MLNNTFKLPDQRSLVYAVYGPADGEPVLYFHGTPSSRLEPMLVLAFGKNPHQLCEANDVRLIAVDRPGIGLSSFNASSSIKSFADDVSHLTSFLKIQRAKILCWSGGGPYSLSLAFHYPDLISHVFIIAGFSRSFSESGVYEKMNGNKLYFSAARRIPWLLRPVLTWAARQQSDKPVPRFISKLPLVDHQLFGDRERMKIFSKYTVEEACRQGSAGVVREAALYFNAAEYDLSKIQQPVTYWYGLKDNTVAPVHAKSVEQQVASSKLIYLEDEGHFSIYFNHLEDILAQVRRT